MPAPPTSYLCSDLEIYLYEPGLILFWESSEDDHDPHCSSQLSEVLDCPTRGHTAGELGLGGWLGGSGEVAPSHIDPDSVPQIAAWEEAALKRA